MATIDDYAFGRIVIDGHEEHADVILLPGRTIRRWRRRRGHELVIEDLAEVLDELPERLLIGTGAQGRFHTDAAAIEWLAARGGAAHAAGGSPLPRARPRAHGSRLAPDVLTRD